MKRKWKIIATCLVILFLVLSVLLFIEIFIQRKITNNIHFIEYSHYENRADLINYLNVFITAIFSAVSTITGILVYKLSIKIEQQNNIVTANVRYENICMLYDYLMEVIEYVERKVFNKKENYFILEYRENFIKNVYSLNNDVLDNEDIECLRKFNISLRNYINNINGKSNNSHGKLSIKWLYKELFDLNIDIDNVVKISSLKDIELILNLQIISILAKLRKEMKYKFEKVINYDQISLKIINQENDIYIEKKYDDNYYMKNGTGTIKIFETILYDTEPISFKNGKEIYIGQVTNYKPNGNGTYYYRSTSVEGDLNSNDLVDKNAEKITKILEMNNVNTNIYATIKGNFIDGVIDNGIIEYEENKEKKFIKF